MKLTRNKNSNDMTRLSDSAVSIEIDTKMNIEFRVPKNPKGCMPQRFSKFAQLGKWNWAIWSMWLSALFIKVIIRISKVITSNIESVKTSLPKKDDKRTSNENSNNMTPIPHDFVLATAASAPSIPWRRHHRTRHRRREYQFLPPSFSLSRSTSRIFNILSPSFSPSLYLSIYISPRAKFPTH